jgi:hypothetical protein
MNRFYGRGRSYHVIGRSPTPWANPPRAAGPIADRDTDSQLARICYGTSIALAVATVVGALAIWGADLLAGHLS